MLDTNADGKDLTTYIYLLVDDLCLIMCFMTYIEQNKLVLFGRGIFGAKTSSGRKLV